MEGIVNGLQPEDSYPPASPHGGEPEPGNKMPYTNDQGTKPLDWELPNDSADSSDSTSTSPSAKAIESDGNGGDCDAMVEKWRLIRLADKNKSHKKVYPTHDACSAALGQNYSKFLEAFQQGISTSQASKRPAANVPAKRSAAASKHVSKRRRQDKGATLPRPDQHESPITAAQRLAAIATNNFTEAKPQETASASDSATRSPVTQTPRNSTEAKEQPSRRKGVGLYAGNWEYVTDEEKLPEYLSVAEKTADLEGRTTRRAYAKITSKKGAEGSSSHVDPLSGNEVRKSGRPRNNVDYAKISGSEGHAQEVVTSEQSEEGTVLGAQEAKQTAPSTPASSMPDHPSRPTSTSTAPNPEPLERPDRSWNSIVYEILATSETPLTFSQLVQGVKDRYPFFNSPSQKKVLKSGPKNPLYFHEAFCKGDIIDGKQTWALRPGEFVDKKTGEVLTPRPRYTLSSSKIATQAQEMGDQDPGDSAFMSSPIYNPRSGNPRFGREILNSPEIPDSQDAKATASGPQEVHCRIATEQASDRENSDRQSAALIGHKTHEPANAANGALVFPSIGTSFSGQAPQPDLQLAATSGSTPNAPPDSESPIADGPKTPSLSNPIGTIDREPSEKTPQSSGDFQAAPPRTSPVPSSTEVNGHDTSLPNAQAASTSAQPLHMITPTYVHTLFQDYAALAQSPAVVPATPTTPAYPLTYTQLDGLVAEGEAGAK